MRRAIENVNPDLTLPGYRFLEQIYAGSRTLVYRAVQLSQQRPVIIKVLRNAYPNFNELVQFRNQYAITANLDIPGIVRPLSLEPWQNAYALVMEDSGSISLDSYVKEHPLNLDEVLSLGVQLAEILHHLQSNRIIHKDIKPANILIHPSIRKIQLIDFSISSLLPRETQEIQNPNVLEGTLAYIAPEQTGRMNRGIDYRADFYSLGVTLYELLTGQLPFLAEVPLELVHCHIARPPLAPHEIDPAIPEAVSAVVLKLMSKNAEDRYQSALGLKFDLEECARQWQTIGTIDLFLLGTRDTCDRFLIPEKLYGREREVSQLLAAFERVARGTSEIMLVAGYSGIGKTAIINEIHKPITEKKGYFIKGKFDQFNRNVPFSAFLQALRDLVGQLLADSDEKIEQWRQEILTAVGDSGRVLIEVMPELEQIVGLQPPAAELSGNAAQNRFYLLFQKFIEIFATAGHPLIIFLDDLQWADRASLQLIKLLMEERDYLLFLGAYRSNEVSAAHPFILTVEELKKYGIPVNTIVLAPLNFKYSNQLVAETLCCPSQAARPLTEVINRKTQGNPFFLTQFLKALHEEGEIVFNSYARYWQCDLNKIYSLSLTENIVDFLGQQLQKLPEATREILKLAACIGDRFELETLAIICEQDRTLVATALWKALQERLIIPTSQVYKFFQSESEPENITHPAIDLTYHFLHDRIQQAAYSLIAEDLKPSVHYRIGQLLLAKTPAAALGEKIFEIVNQLNIGKTLIRDRDEKERLVRLNLEAGEKAKSATAYAAAREFFETGIELLESGWQHQYDLCLTLHTSVVEASYLNGDFEAMGQWSQIVLERAQSLLDRVKIYQIQIQAYQAQDLLLDAIALALEVLEQLDVRFPKQPNFDDIQQALAEISERLRATDIEALIDLPHTADPQTLAAISILASVIPSANQAAPPLLPLIVQKAVSLSLEKGNTLESPFTYAMYGAVLCCVGGRIETGYRFARLGLNLLQRFSTREFVSRTYFIANFLVLHWQDPLHQTLAPLQEAYHIGLETGDLEHASWAATYYCGYAYCSGKSLVEVEREMVAYDEAIRHAKQETPLNALAIFHQAVLTWLDRQQDFQALTGETYNLEGLLQLFQRTQNHFAIATNRINQLILAYGLEDFNRAVLQVEAAAESLVATAGGVVFNLYYFYASLAYLAIYPQVDSARQVEILEMVRANQTQLERWANSAPANNQHRFALVAAELHRVRGEKVQALEAYDCAIDLSKISGYLQEESLANELAAKFYLEWGKPKVAAGYLQEAYYGYARWGAKAKTDHLEKTYPQLLVPILQSQLTGSRETFATITHSYLNTVDSNLTASLPSTNLNSNLDLATILQVAQSLSRSIELEELLTRLAHIILQSSGGDFCALILPERDGKWYSRAIATSDRSELIYQSLDQCEFLPIKLIQYVKNTCQLLALDSPFEDSPVIDRCLLETCPQSVLLLPLLDRGKLIGLLYLQNQLTKGAFTRDRLQILEFLCAQAAISLENAQLHAREREKSQHLEQSQKHLALLIKQAPIPIIEWDANYRISIWNPVAEKLFGYLQEEILGQSWQIIVPDECLVLTDEVATQVLDSERGMHSINENVTKDGKRLICEWFNAPMFDENGEISGGISMAFDITERQRTQQEVIQKTEDLKAALTELQRAQLQIVQSEKMSALGSLVAGVAHEINNPVSFIRGNLQPTESYIEDLLDLIELYQKTYPQPTAELDDKIEAIELDYIREDLPQILASMEVGVERIAQISTSLRAFSRTDRDYKVPYNLHEGIDSTLLILKHRLKANERREAIEVVKEYGELPEIHCYPGQLNQVFMNLISNAIDAIEEAQERKFVREQSWQIAIATELEGDRAIVRIADNGVGLSEELRARIFEQGFTTKAVGKGTGLGLTISYQIVVEKHEGTLSVRSRAGEGTEFAIAIPQ